ncbi:glycosyltransferase family 4 protein [Maribacter flavus]|uniref:Glycosyltransferase family 4 protein n=1 Tax=Maribacter flavus TaxID=1658664 RepID=A0A5B2TUE7_9FLAO|nr:glycosyltransferase family 4 protein [Maribacter flavus]KAA2217465.1 glycosyltransferase family 4 protein [Maribacter flavus]
MSSTTQQKEKIKIIRTAAVPGSLYTLLKGQLAYLNQEYEIIGVSSDGPLLQETSKREGIRTIAVPIERNISPLKDLQGLFKLYKVLKEEKPYMVHSITPKAGLLSMMAAYFARVPKRVHMFTGLIFPTQTGFKKQLLLFFDKLICKFATHVYPEGNGVKNDLINFGVTKKPLNVIANGNVNGLNLDYFSPDHYSEEDTSALKSQLNLSSSDFLWVYVGRLVNDKGVNELMEAFNSLTKKYKNTKLILVGSDDGETDILPLATREIIHGHPDIVAIGQQKDVRPFLALADAFVFPSYREGFPNVVLEAGAMGLPAIVTDINGSNEIIIDGENGLIIPSKDSLALQKAMERFLTDSSLVNSMSQKARILIVNRYNRDLVWAALSEEYKKIIAH